MRAASLVLLLALLLTACGSPVGTAIDGWEIGPPIVCSVQRCEALVPAAVRYLDRTFAGHAPIVEQSLHEWPPARLLAYSGGPPRVAVLRLADGSVRAIGVKYIGIDSVPSIFGIGPDGEAQVLCSGPSCYD